MMPDDKIDRLIEWMELVLGEIDEEADKVVWLEVARLARLGDAVESMPRNNSLKHIDLFGIEPAEREWIYSFYQGPGLPYIYSCGATPLEALEN